MPGIGRRWTSETAPARKLAVAQVNDAVQRYRAGEPAHVIAASLGVAASALSYHFRQRGVPKITAEVKTGVCRHCWTVFEYLARHSRGAPRLFCSRRCKEVGYVGMIHANAIHGVATMSTGYVTIRPAHDRGTRRRRCSEHVVIAEKALGRRMRRGEVVHHINGDKGDNRPQNLLICSRSYHNALHARMSYLYQREAFGTAA